KYQLLVLEFIGYLDRERNTDLRKNIIHMIENTDFSKDLGDFNKQLRAALKDYLGDYNLLQNQITAFYYTYFDRKQLIDNINNTVYDFDHITINRLKNMNDSDVKSELSALVRKFIVEVDFNTQNIKFPNIYLPCGDMDENPGYCRGD